ncbi:hypothetical protein PV726_36645 [Streptomyces europaeiscabiei]|uniref:hypothetical protein n=1 Tax=Streptomyces europaeiscabiei TaxID=146819 RepID=UPI0029BF0BF4|nr:hypothetical protein [Streptomyces europaeiscabiei]MDX3695751.1 hypothetical protein [Streptomyces europaeiscabiei]
MHDAVLEYGRAALRDEELGAEPVAAYDGWLQLDRDGVRTAVDADLIREPDDIDGERVGATTSDLTGCLSRLPGDRPLATATGCPTPAIPAPDRA